MSDSRFRKVFISLLDVLLNIRPDNVKQILLSYLMRKVNVRLD